MGLIVSDCSYFRDFFFSPKPQRFFPSMASSKHFRFLLFTPNYDGARSRDCFLPQILAIFGPKKGCFFPGSHGNFGGKWLFSSIMGHIGAKMTDSCSNIGHYTELKYCFYIMLFFYLDLRRLCVKHLFLYGFWHFFCKNYPPRK